MSRPLSPAPPRQKSLIALVFSFKFLQALQKLYTKKINSAFSTVPKYADFNVNTEHFHSVQSQLKDLCRACTEFDSGKISGCAQSSAHTGHQSVWWPRLTVLNLAFKNECSCSVPLTFTGSKSKVCCDHNDLIFKWGIPSWIGLSQDTDTSKKTTVTLFT